LLGELPGDKARGARCQRYGHLAPTLARVVDELVDDEARSGADGKCGSVAEEHLHDAGGRRGAPVVVEHLLSILRVLVPEPGGVLVAFGVTAEATPTRYAASAG